MVVTPLRIMCTGNTVTSAIRTAGTPASSRRTSRGGRFPDEGAMSFQLDKNVQQSAGAQVLLQAGTTRGGLMRPRRPHGPWRNANTPGVGNGQCRRRRCCRENPAPCRIKVASVGRAGCVGGWRGTGGVRDHRHPTRAPTGTRRIVWLTLDSGAALGPLAVIKRGWDGPPGKKTGIIMQADWAAPEL